jgi:hypothetical protein
LTVLFWLKQIGFQVIPKPELILGFVDDLISQKDVAMLRSTLNTCTWKLCVAKQKDSKTILFEKEIPFEFWHSFVIPRTPGTVRIWYLN